MDGRKIIGIILLIIAAILSVRMLLNENGTAEGEAAVHFIDVGQGDCIYIECGGENMLIDCGEASAADEVCGYLDKMGVKALDYVIATHPHSDHMGGMSEIITSYDIGEIIIPHLADNDIPTTKYFTKFLEAVSSTKTKLTEAKLGRTINIGEAECELIAPCSADYGNKNNYSVGVIMYHGSNSFIFTGDAESSAEKEMLKSGRLRDIDVYKVAHHGSDTSSSDEFLKAISPDIAVISCGAGNSYGHPCASTLKKLEKYTDEIYRTDLSGTIVVTSDGEKLDVTTERKEKKK